MLQDTSTGMLRTLERQKSLSCLMFVTYCLENLTNRWPKFWPTTSTEFLMSLNRLDQETCRVPDIKNCPFYTSRVRRFKKPRSTVPGDIFPLLVTQFADFLVVPLANIYNSITSMREWPVCWKREYATIIPKKSSPQSLTDLRNISCTLLASKIYESYIFD